MSSTSDLSTGSCGSLSRRVRALALDADALNLSSAENLKALGGRFG